VSQDIISEINGEVHKDTKAKPILPDFYKIDSNYIENEAMKVPAIDISSLLNNSFFYKSKRIFDIVFSLFILIFFSPLWILVSLLVKAESKGPIIYRQKRIGKNGKEFELLKFRSMIDDAEMLTGPVWAAENDYRITKVGKIIRKFGIDEIPQLVNVLKGDMSVIGPRPERPFFIEKLDEIIPFYSRRHKVKPGITGLAQIKHKYDSNIEDVVKKLEYDFSYMNNLSIKLEFFIFLSTFYIIITGKGKF